jgi:hypothetical protein
MLLVPAGQQQQQQESKGQEMGARAQAGRQGVVLCFGGEGCAAEGVLAHSVQDFVFCTAQGSTASCCLHGH